MKQCLLLKTRENVAFPKDKKTSPRYTDIEYNFKEMCTNGIRDKWVPVTTAWRVLGLQMEERPPIWRVAANILNKLSRTADKGQSSNLGVRRGADNWLC
jgi:hypothetical protein